MARLRSSLLEGLHVLVVEDDYQVAESLGEMLSMLGCSVIGPAATIEKAAELLEQNEVDAAILDVALLTGTSAAIARSLQARRCPFLFLTGFADDSMLPEDLHGKPLLLKPVDCATMLSAIRSLLGRDDGDGQTP